MATYVVTRTRNAELTAVNVWLDTLTAMDDVVSQFVLFRSSVFRDIYAYAKIEHVKIDFLKK